MSNLDNAGKPRVAVATDSNSGMTQEEGRRRGVGVIPMPCLIDGKEYFEDISITRDEFFQRQESDADVQTSQPSPESLITLWDKLLEDHEGVVYIPMSGGLSGSVQTAMILAEEYDGRVQVVDNHRIAPTQKQSVLEAVELAKAGWDAKAIRDFLMEHAYDASIYIAVDTLKYLKKGGRVTAAGAAIGTLLNIKPILQIQGEKLDAFAKVRGMKQAQEKMMQAVEADIKGRFAGCEVMIQGAHTCDAATAEQWRQTLAERFPGHKISVDPLALSISCHIGAGSLAVVCSKIQPEASGFVYELE